MSMVVQFFLEHSVYHYHYHSIVITIIISAHMTE